MAFPLLVFLVASSRSSSPIATWEKSYLLASRILCTSLPEPGPPNIKMMIESFNFSAAKEKTVTWKDVFLRQFLLNNNCTLQIGTHNSLRRTEFYRFSIQLNVDTARRSEQSGGMSFFHIKLP